MKHFCNICKKETAEGTSYHPCTLTNGCTGKLIPLSLIDLDYENFDQYIPQKITEWKRNLDGRVFSTQKKNFLVNSRSRNNKLHLGNAPNKKQLYLGPKEQEFADKDFTREQTMSYSTKAKELLKELAIKNPIHGSCPDIVHFIWFGRVLPITYMCNIADCLKLNPSYTAKLWTSDVQTMTQYIETMPLKREDGGKSHPIEQTGLKNNLVLINRYKKTFDDLGIDMYRKNNTSYKILEPKQMNSGYMDGYKSIDEPHSTYAKNTLFSEKFPDGVSEFKELLKKGRIEIVSVNNIEEEINFLYPEKISHKQQSHVLALYDLALNLIGGPKKHFAVASDILRLILILTEGGIYLDTDTYFHPKMQSINSAIANREPSVSLMLGGKVDFATEATFNAIMFGPQYSRGALMMLEIIYSKLRKAAGHKPLVQTITDNEFKLDDNFVLLNTGPNAYQEYLSLFPNDSVIKASSFALILSDKNWK